MPEEKKPSPDMMGKTVEWTIDPYIEQFILKMLEHLADWRPIDAMLRDLNPATASVVSTALPGLAGFAIARIPEAAFKSPEAAYFVRSKISEAAKIIADIVAKKQKISPDEHKESLEQASKAVDERKVVVDPLGHFHLPECARLIAFKRPPHPKQQQQQPYSVLQEISLKAAIDQKLKASPCCLPGIQEELKKAETPAKSAAKRPQSPMEVIGSMSKKERRAFTGWLDSLSGEQRARALCALHELDSELEFTGFMAMDPALRLEVLPLLENRNAIHAVKAALGIIGFGVKAGFRRVGELAKKAWASFKEFDDSLAPIVAKLEADFNGPKAERKKVPWSWKMFLPF